MAHLKLLLNSLIITVAMAFSTDNDSKINLCTAINIDLPKSLKPDLIFKVYYFDMRPQIDETNYKNEDIFSIKQYNEKQQANDFNNDFSYYSTYYIDVPINRQTKTICLHVLNQDVDETDAELYFFHKSGDKSVEIERRLKNVYNDKEKFFVFDFGNNILSLLDAYQLDFAICKLRVYVQGVVTNDQESNFFRTFYIDGKKKERHWLIAAGDFQASGAVHVISCWIETTIKSKFNITINHEKKHRVLSNVQMKRRTDDNPRKDMSLTEFLFTDEIPLYLLTFVVSDLPLLFSKYGMNMWGRQLASLELKFAWNIVANVTFRSKEIWYNKCNKTDVLSISEKWYKKCDEGGKKRKRILIFKLNHVVIPGFRDEGMRSFGLDYYNEAAIIYNKTLDTIACKVKVAQIVARKTVLLLLGNMIRLSSWSHLWLNEGIATFMGMYIVNQIIPDFRMMDLFVVQNQHESLRLNFYYDVPLIVKTDTISEIKSLSPLSRYLKAPVFMRMLQHVMTNESFWLGLNLYLDRQFITVKNHSADTSNLTFDNFWIAMTTSLETTCKTKSDLQEKFNNWMVHGHYPVLNVTRDYKEKDTNVIIKLSQRESYSNYWKIPITYTTKTNSNFTKTTPDYWLEPHISSLKVSLMSKNEWIIVNIQQAGYYRVNYDWKNWQLIADYLRFEDHTRIHVLNRAQIIDDLFHFLLTREIRYSMFSYLTTYLSKETDYIAWYPMFKVFEQMSWLLPYNQSIYFKIHMSYILNELLDKIGYEETLFENPLTVSLRQEAAKWACTLDSSKCKETATKILTKHFSENKMQNILPGWKHWIYCNGFMTAEQDNSFWRKLFDYFRTNFSSNGLEIFACCKNFSTIKTLMVFTSGVTSDDNKMRNDYINSFRSLIAKHARNNAVLDYLLAHLDIFLSIGKISKIALLTSIINHVYSTDQIDKIRNFINHFNSAELNSYIPMLHRKLEIRLSEINRQIQYLQKIL